MILPWHDFFTEILEKRFKELKAKNSRYSLRAFARLAQVSPGAMSHILKRNSDWQLSIERAFEILQRVKVSPDIINYFAVLTSPRCIDQAAPLSSQDKHVFLSNPFYAPICMSFGLSPQPSIDNLAETLQLPTTEVMAIIEDLISRGYLQKDEAGVISRTKSQKLATGDGPSDEVIRQHHLANMDSIRHSLIHGSTTDRNVTSLILTGSSKQKEAVIKEINQFHERVHAILNSSDEKDEVFKILVGFMPMKFSLDKETELS